MGGFWALIANQEMATDHPMAIQGRQVRRYTVMSSVHSEGKHREFAEATSILHMVRSHEHDDSTLSRFEDGALDLLMGAPGKRTLGTIEWSS